MSISTAFFVSPCLILFCIVCSTVYVNGKTNKLKLKDCMCDSKKNERGLRI